MIKTVYIHIGAHKTGTTAIQAFLSANRELLKKKGYLYPGKQEAHHIIGYALKNNETINDILNSDIRKILHEIKKTDCHTLVLSSETFTETRCAAKLKQVLEKTLTDSVTIKIIYYCRRQDHLLQSAYQQRVKTREPDAVTTPITQFLIDNKIYLHFWDSYQKLEEWKKEFGKEAILVNVYEKDQMYKNDLISDFLHIMGLELTEDCKLPTKNQSNRGLGPDVIEMIRLVNIKNNNLKLKRFLMDTVRTIDQKPVWEPYSLLPPRERLNIIMHFDESNQKVAREYLGREDGKLYYEPLPDPDEPWEPYGGLTVEKVVPIFTQMIYNIDRTYNQPIEERKNRSLKQRMLRTIKAIGARLGL